MEDQFTQYGIQIGGTAGVILSAFLAWLKTAKSSPEHVARDVASIKEILKTQAETLKEHGQTLHKLDKAQAVGEEQRKAIESRIGMVERRFSPQGGSDDNGHAT